MARNNNNSEITMTQTGLIEHIIKYVGVLHLPTKLTPAHHVPLVKDEDGDPCDSHFNYCIIVGMLQYLQNHSRPDITYAVSQCARFTHNPQCSHELAIIHICQYLCGTMETV
jgi:hypothetical protein